MERPRWYKIQDGKGNILYARKGFGRNGESVRIMNPKIRYGTGSILTKEECLSKYKVIKVLDPLKEKKVEENYQWELNR